MPRKLFWESDTLTVDTSHLFGGTNCTASGNRLLTSDLLYELYHRWQNPSSAHPRGTLGCDTDRNISDAQVPLIEIKKTTFNY